MRDWRRIPVAVGLTVLVTVAVFAQSNKWYDPYQKGVKALEAGRYRQAVTLLQQAILADPKGGPNKYVEGVFRSDYFPYYYLGIANLELKEYDAADENFGKANTGLPRPLLTKLDDYKKRLASEVLLAKGGGGTTPPPQPAKPTINPNFDPAIKAADAALAAKRFADAVDRFDAAKAADPNEFAKENVQARRDEAARGVTAMQLADEGRQLLQRSQLNAAKVKLQQADQTLPGQKAVTDALAEIRQREDTYQRLKTTGEQEFRSGNFQGAVRNFDQARTANPDLFAADRLEARVRAANERMREASNVTPAGGGTIAGRGDAGRADVGRGDAGRGGAVDPNTSKQDSLRQFEAAKLLAAQGKYAEAERGFAAAVTLDPGNQAADEALKNSHRFTALRTEAADLASRGDTQGAQQRYSDARALDGSRFEREGLTAMLDKLVKQPGQDPERTALRNALVALFQGNTERSIAILEPAATSSDTGKPATAAALHAYLGVAYATQALAAARQDDAARALREKALAQFRLAVSAQRDYQLSSRLVSPKIVALFEQAKS